MEECRNCGVIALFEGQKVCHECKKQYRKDWMHPSQGIKSMMKNKFTEFTAFCEVIDNSIQAGATNVKVKMETSSTDIVAMAFGDDGIGMDAETLEGCLSIGESSRYGDQSEDGLGRFGVGMKFAALNQARRCSVWSKTLEGEWMFTYLDVDEISSGSLPNCPIPIQQDPPAHYSNLHGKDHGTLVLWEKYYGRKKSIAMISKEAPIYLGRTYRYFIWNEGPNGESILKRKNPLRLFFDGEELHAVDPLYANKNNNRFPDDPPATVWAPMKLIWPVSPDTKKDTEELGRKAPDESEIRIRFSILPDEWLWPGQANVTEFCEPRGITKESTGFSILRNYREVFFGPINGNVWRHVKPKGQGWSRFEDLDRWWGCEIMFDAWLDDRFDVSNVKGATPTEKLMETIKKTLLPSRQTATEEIQTSHSKFRASKKKEEDRRRKEADERRKHQEAEDIAANSPTGQHHLHSDKDVDEALEEWSEDRKDYITKEEIAAIKNDFQWLPFRIEETSFPGSKFFDSAHFGGKAIIELNTTHIFFEHVHNLLGSLDDPEGEDYDPAEVVEQMRLVITLMIVAYARAEANFDEGLMLKAETFIDDFRSYWGQFLTTYLHKMKEDEN
jgi:hypothetical protein